ncbi:unnamed protein product [Urochloa decumbens]|uniref:DUF6598 domain-containing protein n=1 Tax=Urochloa decumbens TaxID=240449 RepID=A0ABC9FSC3_9POAL
MADAAEAWWEESRAWEDRMDSISKESMLLLKRMHGKDFLAGLSEPERSAKQAEAQEERLRLIQKHTQHHSEMVSAPDFSGMTESERAVAAERLRDKEMQRARSLRAEGRPSDAPTKLEALARIVDFDPKQGGLYYPRFTFGPTTFDLDEESPFGPMRYTDALYESERDYHYLMCGAVNILSVKIACSDVGFPIRVYGTVIVRDSVDERCVYNFRCSGDHCQLINSEAESLILTGPKRGLALLGDIYVEIDLKIKDHLGQDRELSKGLLIIRGLASRSLTGSVVQTRSLATRLSTVDVTYRVVERAVEGTIAVEVLQGGFHGKITANTSSIQEIIVLYDSKEADALAVDDCGDIQLMRPVVSVDVEDTLLIDAHTSDDKSECILFTPRVNGGDEIQINVGATKMRVKLFWSLMNP